VRFHLPLILACFLPSVARADIDFSLPLSGDYAVIQDASRATCFLAIVDHNNSSFGYHEVVPGIEEIAVAGTLITGKANGRLFLLDARTTQPTPQFFATAEQWSAALKAAGVPKAPQLMTPQARAANLPDKTLRPWNYRMMGGKLGLSDDEWSAAIQGIGLVLAFLLGILLGQRSGLMGLAIFLGIVINVVAQVFVAGGGPGAAAGFFVLPLIFMLLAAGGRLLREGVAKFRDAILR
jgi:hypothetical protein